MISTHSLVCIGFPLNQTSSQTTASSRTWFTIWVNLDTSGELSGKSGRLQVRIPLYPPRRDFGQVIQSQLPVVLRHVTPAVSML